MSAGRSNPKPLRSWKEGRKLFHEAKCSSCGRLFTFPAARPRLACSRACTSKLICERSPRGRPAVWHRHTCIVCGRGVRVTGREAVNGRTTCSAACSSALRSQLIMEQLPGLHAASAVAIAQSPKVGPFATNIHARSDWSLIDPEGELHQFANLQNFLRSHAHLFAEEDLLILSRRTRASRASNGLYSLAPWRLKPKASWKGWQWYAENSQ